MANASAILHEISGALDALAVQIQTVHNSPTPMNEQWGWHMPSMSVLDLADYVRSPKAMILRIDSQSISDSDINRLNVIPSRIQYLQANVVPQVPGGNSYLAYEAISTLVEYISIVLNPYDKVPIDLEALDDNNLLPAAQMKQLKMISRGIKKLSVESEELQLKISEINDAHSAAQAFPANMQMLEEAREEFDKSKNELKAILADTNNEIDINLAQIYGNEKKIYELRSYLEGSREEAENILSNLGAAYSAATTVGLGAAFSERAKELTQSTYWLGAVLVFALSMGGLITYSRVEFVHKLMMSPNVSYGILWVNVTFTALSVSAPVWLAWFLTRQIGQRFRLAEDYGYKASIAKAYEGYRREAANIDPALGKVLFATALEKLGEAPLRLVEKESPGSPAHDAHVKVEGMLKQKISKSPPVTPKAPESDP